MTPATTSTSHDFNSLTLDELGHWHLGFWFRPLLRVDASGLLIGKRHYLWREIEDFSQSDPAMIFLAGFPLGKPSANIRFADGTRLKIDGRSLGSRSMRPRVAFWSGVSSTYSALVREIESRRREWVPAGMRKDA
jgi:hypothetical protein